MKSYCLRFWQIAYNGNNYLALNEDLCFKFAQGGAAGHSRNDLEGDCREWLHRQLEDGKDTLLRAGTRGARPL